MLLHDTNTGQWDSSPAARGKRDDQLERPITTWGPAIKNGLTQHGKWDRFPARPGLTGL